MEKETKTISIFYLVSYYYSFTQLIEAYEKRKPLEIKE